MLKRILPLFLLLAFGCIDPLNMGKMKQQKHLVVEGSFTNIPELNYVRLSYAQPYDYHYNEFVTNAQVYITSSEGDYFRFNYKKDNSTLHNPIGGSYYPEAPLEAVGVAGCTYTLHVAVNGKYYQSQPITVKQLIPIDTVHFEIDEQPFSFRDRTGREKWPGYRVLVDYQDPAEEKNFLRWTFFSQYEIEAQPEDYLYGPKECCVQCFLEEKLDKFKVVDDRLTNGRRVTNQEVLFLPFEQYLYVKHKLWIYQYAITEEAYNFFRIMEQQKEAKGTVFDPPPAEVRGNMFNVEDAEETVIGFFDAAMVDMQLKVILGKEINYPVERFIFPDDCRLMIGASREPPQGWYD